LMTTPTTEARRMNFIVVVWYILFNRRIGCRLWQECALCAKKWSESAQMASNLSPYMSVRDNYCVRCLLPCLAQRWDGSRRRNVSGTCHSPLMLQWLGWQRYH
jgi:hypothetical protein